MPDSIKKFETINYNTVNVELYYEDVYILIRRGDSSFTRDPVEDNQYRHGFYTKEILGQFFKDNKVV